ncbi:MAG: hypothetical protein JXA97_05985 [Anaerolineales bacterium]|nr:hypothetical protein [Anaerolineales bacterium]
MHTTPSNNATPTCWFCGTRTPNPDISYTLYFYKGDREKRVVVHRCDDCKAVHNRIVLWQGLAGIVGILAIGLIIPVGEGLGWLGAVGEVVLLGGITFVMVRKAAEISRTAGVKMEADYKSQHELIRKLQKDGWRQTPPRAGGKPAASSHAKKPAKKAEHAAAVGTPQRREEADVLANHLLNLRVGTTVAELTNMFGQPVFSMDSGAAFSGKMPAAQEGMENRVYRTPFGEFVVTVKDGVVVDMQSVDSVRKNAERHG